MMTLSFPPSVRVPIEHNRMKRRRRKSQFSPRPFQHIFLLLRETRHAGDAPHLIGFSNAWKQGHLIRIERSIPYTDETVESVFVSTYERRVGDVFVEVVRAENEGKPKVGL